MPRPSKNGLDYFPLDTVMDDNFACIEAKYGLPGFAIIIKLYQKIYFENGYFYPWGEKEQLLFSANTKTTIEQLNFIISDAISFGIFDKGMFDKKQVLTSHGIQKRYFSVCKRKKQLLVYDDLLLTNIDFLTDSDSDVNVVIKTYKCSQDVCNMDASCEHNTCKSTEKEIGKKKGKYGNMEKGNMESENDGAKAPRPPQSKKNKKEFQPPSEQQCVDYCLERHLVINPHTFFRYYDPEWVDGNSKPVANWKLKMKTWDSKERDANHYAREYSESPPPTTTESHQHTTDEESAAAFERVKKHLDEVAEKQRKIAAIGATNV